MNIIKLHLIGLASALTFIVYVELAGFWIGGAL